MALGFFIFNNHKNISNKPTCQNKEFKIPITLQSGERGVIKFTDDHCNKSLNQKEETLSFKVLKDNGLEDNLYGSRLYFWLRDTNLSLDQQIIKVANKNGFCQVEKNKYPQANNLTTFSLSLMSQVKTKKMANDYCLVLGPKNNFSSESFLEINNLLVLQRQDGLDGIMPINLNSLSFIKN